MSDHFITLKSGLKLAYAVHGAENGVPFFYFHGWPSARVQGQLMDAVGKKYGLKIISPDRPGIGESDFQPNRTLQDWADTISQLADHLDAKAFHVMGWSGGGPYVLLLALAMPERLRSASIVCGAPPLTFLGYDKMFWPYRLMIRLRSAFPSILALVLRLGARISRGDADKPPLSWLLRMLGTEDRRILSQPEVFNVVRDGILEALRRGPKSVIADADIYLQEWGFEVSRVHYPIQFWHGKQDRNIDWRYTEQLAAIMPQTRTHWSEHDGHYSLPIVRAEEIVRVALNAEAEAAANAASLEPAVI